MNGAQLQPSQGLGFAAKGLTFTKGETADCSFCFSLFITSHFLRYITSVQITDYITFKWVILMENVQKHWGQRFFQKKSCSLLQSAVYFHILTVLRNCFKHLVNLCEDCRKLFLVLFIVKNEMKNNFCTLEVLLESTITSLFCYSGDHGWLWAVLQRSVPCLDHQGKVHETGLPALPADSLPVPAWGWGRDL